jgi:hypothetical protein
MASSTSAAPLFVEDFNVDATANWQVNNGPGTHASNFFFDYSTVGIPPAPGSGPLTRGLKLEANVSGGVFGGLSTSPIGLNLTGDYKLRFWYWGNFQGPLPAGGSGTTQLGTYGVGTNGTLAQWPGAATQNSVWFGATVDGGSGQDYRAYSSAAPTSYLPSTGVYAAGNVTTPIDVRNNSHPYYATLGTGVVPPGQTLLFPATQTGVTQVGAAGFEWHNIEIIKNGSTVTWRIDGLPIANVNSAAATLAGGNIFLGHSDTNAGSSADAIARTLLFSLFENVVVTRIPEPASMTMLAASALGLMATARRRRQSVG